MKNKYLSLFIAFALALALVGVASPVSAAAYGTSFVTSITYQNVGAGPANVTIDFFAESSATAITITPAVLAANAGTSLYVGSLAGISAGFSGSAVMSSDQPLIATMVQVPPAASAVKSRPLSSGASTGAASVLVPTVLKNTFGYTSVVSIQNVDSVAADVTVEFIPTSGTGFTIPIANLPAGAAKYFDMGTLVNAGLGASFSGSIRATAVKTGTSTAGSLVANSLEMGVSANKAYAFEGATTSATKIYMPSAFCKWSGYASTYAVQNTGTSAVDVTVTYSNGNTESYNAVAGGAKVSVPGCGKDALNPVNPDNFIGSAVLTATGPIVAMAKISNTAGLITAFLGFPDGSNKVGAPFVRWTTANWAPGGRSRAVLAIQNIGAADLAAGDVVVNYYDKNGVLVGTHTLGAIAVNAKTNSNPSNIGAAGNEFGYYADGTFGGSAVVVGPVGSKLAVVVRVSTNTGGSTIDGEDYNGSPLQ